ncbi:MAG: metal ABC transporter substrate-binding protein [Erysipelotrichaceae bacterium]|nr:metal ABC transporter substrate-binding protein [Erysipelotrichaceae bacterium]MDY5251747.1 zinc ABC transporter substrate-binding protein [Erysipelotrichaceae bacterium]
MRKKVVQLLIALLIMLQLTGCTSLNNQVAYTVYPIGYIIQRITQDTTGYRSIQTNEIVQRATAVEDYEEILANSDALFEVGQVEPYNTMYRSIINETVDDIQYLSSLNAIYLFKRYTPVYNVNEVTYIESPYYDSELFANVDTNEKDMYLWLDPIAMLSMAKDVSKWYETKYPDNANMYRENYEKLENELVQLDAAYQKMATTNLQQNKSIKFVSMTSSFGCWQKTYNIEVYPVILSKYGALPTDEQLEVIKNRIRVDNVKYIAYEPNMTDDMKELFNELEEELELTRVELNNLSSLTEEQQSQGKDYISIMYENLQTLESMATSIIPEGPLQNADNLE